MGKLNKRQQIFVSEYLKDANATRAAKAAGYSAKTANEQGCRLLTNVSIAAEVEAKHAKRVEKTDTSAERVIEELGKLAFSNMMDYVTVTEQGEAFVDLSRLTREQAAAIQEVTIDETGGGGGDGRRERVQRTRFKLADKGANLERLGNYHKLFVQKVEHSMDEALADLIRSGRQRISE